jgi:integrase
VPGLIRDRQLAAVSAQAKDDVQEEQVQGQHPKPERNPPTPIRPYTRVELDAIEDELDPVYAPVVPFGAATGLRPEEWSALERRHVDRTGRVVKVEQKNVGATIVLGGKTANSVREMPLTRVAVAALDRVPPRLNTKLLFPAPEGGPLDLGNFRKRDWNPAVEAAGVERPATPYDLRDTFASNALHAGVTVFELARVMGTSVRMIEKHYGALSTAPTPGSSRGSTRSRQNSSKLRRPTLRRERTLLGQCS